MLALHKNDVFADRYLLKELIGARSLSEVWVSEDLLANRAIVAVKIYAPLDRTDEKFLQKIRQEATINQPLHHPNLLQIDSFEIHDGTPYLVMPYMQQGSLRRKLLETGPLTEYELAVLLKQIGGALHELHAAEPEQLHQNIKPDNILMTEDGNYMLADFRIHNQVRPLLPRLGVQAEGLPTAYAPPEQFTVRPGTYPASDIFALGVTMYELCTGELPWMGNGGISLLQGAAVPFLPVRYAKELNNMVSTCMDPKWENRPTAEELALEGNYYIDNQKWKPYGRFSATKVDVIQYKKHSPHKALIWVAAILVALSAVGYFLYTQTDLINRTFGLSSADSYSKTMVVMGTNESGGYESTVSDPAAGQETGASATRPLNTQPRPSRNETAPRPALAETRTEPTTAAQPEQRPEVRRTTYPRPASAEEYLAQIQNESIPHNIRKRWRQDVWRFFDKKAAVNYVVGDELIGILSADELVEIMLDREKTGSIRVDSTKRNAEGKVDQVFVYVQRIEVQEEEE